MKAKKTKRVVGWLQTYGGQIISESVYSLITSVSDTVVITQIGYGHDQDHGQHRSQNMIIVRQILGKREPKGWIIELHGPKASGPTYLCFESTWDQFAGLIRVVHEQCKRYGLKLPEDAG